MIEKRQINSRNAATLEMRISTALGNNGNRLDSGTLSELLPEIHFAITEAEATAKSERSRSLDPAVAPAEAEAAAQRASLAELHRDRLATALPRLQQLLQEALADERRERWSADRQRVKAKRDAVAARLSKAYCDATAQILAAFAEAEETDKEVARLNDEAPDDVWDQRLQSTELHARSLDQFTRQSVSVLEATHLIDWKTGVEIWPPPKPPFASHFMPMVAYHPGARWHEAIPAQREQQQRDNAALTSYYDEQHRRRESHENDDNRRRAAQQQQGGGS